MTDHSVAPTHKTCRDCGETKPVAAFQKNRRICRACRSLYTEKWKNGFRKGPQHPIINGTHKVCSKCGTLKPLDAYRAIQGTGRRLDARRADCRACAAQYEHQYNITHAEQRAVHWHRYYALHRKDILAQALEYYYSHQEERAIYKKTWYETHKEYARNYNRKRAKDHPEKRHAWRKKNRLRELAQRRAHYAVHIEIEREKQRRNYHDNVLQHREYAKKHAALKKNAPLADFTAAQWQMLQEIQHHRCYYCGKRCKGRLTQDHIVPLSKGGAHTLSNIIGACKSCNSRKGNRPPLKPVQALLL